ncbi:hypothetical protein BC937DRAFT_95182 [Endogone sp. FLAS-F59071]|nr:hypothetical protein BC937DRAFT_95182 [Endogone sp. FLAS-F59071]|eukprot:RUS20451.1 hypothetical protein BC937DRAFT_95182 [Endogone sp. FLAS-F59071]
MWNANGAPSSAARTALFGGASSSSAPTARQLEQHDALIYEQQNDVRLQELDNKVSALKNVSGQYYHRYPPRGDGPAQAARRISKLELIRGSSVLAVSLSFITILTALIHLSSSSTSANFLLLLWFRSHHDLYAPQPHGLHAAQASAVYLHWWGRAAVARALLGWEPSDEWVEGEGGG